MLFRSVINQLTVNKGELQPIELKPCVTGEEAEFKKALQQYPINKSTVEELKQVLKLVMLKVGIRANNLPNDIEKAVLIEHIINQYGKHTPAEVRLAFDMAISGKLDLEEKEVICYENFSCLYFSKIMNAYRVWAMQTFNQLKMDNPITTEQELEPIEMIDWIADWKKQENINLLLIPLSFYDFLVDTDMIVLTRDEKIEWFNQSKLAIKTELLAAIPECKTTDALNDWKLFEKSEASKEWDRAMYGRIANRAKRLIVYQYLTKK